MLAAAKLDACHPTHMNPQLVSVIVPTYNRAYCLAQALDSALGQTHADVEVIVVDDGSSDGTREFVNDRYRADERVRYVFQANAGVSAARNRGIQLVRGAYVALLDSDDVWLPFKLKLELACLAAFPEAGMVWTDLRAVDGDGALVADRYLRTFYSAYSWFSNDELFERSRPLAEVAPDLAGIVGDARAWCGEIFSQMVMGNLVHTSTVLMTRERLVATGLFDEMKRSGEDHDFYLRACRPGPVVLADVPTILYAVGRTDQLTRPEYRLHMAQNFLRTATTALDNDRDRIRLPASMVDELLADAYAWVGDALLAEQRLPEARRHLWKSLRHKPMQPRTMALFTLSCAPAAVSTRLRELYRRAKHPVASI